LGLLLEGFWLWLYALAFGLLPFALVFWWEAFGGEKNC
jgi:hypothetical protein